MDVKEQIEKIMPELVGWRRHLHAHPELAFEEKETAAFVAEKLRGYGLDS